MQRIVSAGDEGRLRIIGRRFVSTGLGVVLGDQRHARRHVASDAGFPRPHREALSGKIEVRELSPPHRCSPGSFCRRIQKRFSSPLSSCNAEDVLAILADSEGGLDTVRIFARLSVDGKAVRLFDVDDLKREAGNLPVEHLEVAAV